MQIHVALCDDETSCHDTTKKLLTAYRQKSSSVSLSLSCFFSGRDLWDYIDENAAFDIYILDIIMPDINDIQLGAALREYELFADSFRLACRKFKGNGEKNR